MYASGCCRCIGGQTSPCGSVTQYMSHWAFLSKWKPDPHFYSYPVFGAEFRTAVNTDTVVIVHRIEFVIQHLAYFIAPVVCPT